MFFFFIQIYVLLQGGVRFLIFFCKVTFWFDFEFLHIRIFNWNITYNFSFVIFHHLLLLAILQSDICVGKKVRGQENSNILKKIREIKASKNAHLFYLREFEMFFMSNVYEEQMCFEELHLHDLFFDEKKLKQKYYTFAKKSE